MNTFVFDGDADHFWPYSLIFDSLMHSSVPPPVAAQWQNFQEKAVMYLPHHFSQDDPALLLEAMRRPGDWQ